MQLTKKCPKYTYRKDGVYYFSKAVPKDLLDLYSKPRIVKCLGTWSPQVNLGFSYPDVGQAIRILVG